MSLATLNTSIAFADTPQLLRLVGLVAAAALAAYVAVGKQPKLRAAALLITVVLTPVLLLTAIWDSPQLATFRDRPAVAAAALVVGLLGLLLLAWLFGRYSTLVVAAVVVALPLRLPLQFGGNEANLLLPLYLVIAAMSLVKIRSWLKSTDGQEGQQATGTGRAVSLLLGVSTVLYALQATYSSDADKALEQLVFFYLPFLLLYVFLSELKWSKRAFKAALYGLVVLAVFFVAVGFYEYGTHRLLFNPKVINSNQFEEYFRVNSLFFDPNIYGRFLAAVMLLLAAVMLWAKRGREVFTTAVLLAVLLAGLVLTFSQSSFAGLLVGLIVLGTLRWGVKSVLLPAASVVVVAAAVVALFPSALKLDVGSNKTIDKATSGRFDLINGGLEMFADRPLLGYGSGSFAKEYRKQQKTSNERAASASHTVPVTVAAEQGVVGLILYFGLLICAFILLFKGARGDPLRAFLAAAFVALVVHTQAYAAFLEDPLSWALLAVAVAVVGQGFRWNGSDRKSALDAT